MNVILNKLKNNLNNTFQQNTKRVKKSKKKIVCKLVVNFFKHILQKNGLKQHVCSHVQVVQRLRFSSVLVTSESNSEGVLIHKYDESTQ